MEEPIPMLDLKREYEYLKPAIDAAIQRCLEHQRWIWGPEVAEFEQKVAAYLETKHAIGVSSGTDALVLALRALAIKYKGKEFFDPEDEIITTPFTFTATGMAILRAGATPVFVDVDPHTFNIDPEGIRAYLQERGERVVGMLPVHLYGQAADMDAIMELARAYDLFVLEDVAQAFGGAWKEQKLGSIGTAGAFSFFPSKNLGAFGDGGMVVTQDDELADLVRKLSRQGGRDKYNAEHVGYNARLDTLQAAILLAKLDHLDEFNERRRTVAATYTAGLSGLDHLIPPQEAPGAHHVYHQYTVWVKRDREGLQAHLSAQGIASMIYYPVPLHRMQAFQGRSILAGSLSVAEEAARSVLSLPIGPLQEEAVTFKVLNAVQFWAAREVDT